MRLVVGRRQMLIGRTSEMKSAVNKRLSSAASAMSVTCGTVTRLTPAESKYCGEGSMACLELIEAQHAGRACRVLRDSHERMVVVKHNLLARTSHSECRGRPATVRFAC